MSKVPPKPGDLLVWNGTKLGVIVIEVNGEWLLVFRLDGHNFSTAKRKCFV